MLIEIRTKNNQNRRNQTNGWKSGVSVHFREFADFLGLFLLYCQPRQTASDNHANSHQDEHWNRKKKLFFKNFKIL